MDELLDQYQAVFADSEYQTHNMISLLANSSAFIMTLVPNLNWAGFYLWQPQHQQLELGPFQGQLACSQIMTAKSVCGQAFHQQKSLRVANVHDFKDHIACDSATNAELVLPLSDGNRCYGVLDLDSPQLNRFSTDDEKVLQQLADLITQQLNQCDDIMP